MNSAAAGELADETLASGQAELCQKPKLGPRQVTLAREMYDERGVDGKRRYTVEQIAAEFGVTRPTIYRHLGKAPLTLSLPRQHPDRLPIRLTHAAQHPSPQPAHHA